MFTQIKKVYVAMIVLIITQIVFGQTRAIILQTDDGERIVRTVAGVESIRFDNDACVDIDGNVYSTVTIGTQVWTAENLKVTHYRNEDAITNETTDDAAWKALSTEAYCAYNNDASNESDTYGYLYNWYAVSDVRNIAPVGWHVPTDAEWTILTNYLGGESVAADKMKETGTNRWETSLNPAVIHTNESGFTALPGGDRYDGTGEFRKLGLGAYFWSSTSSGAINAWFRSLSYTTSSVNRNYRYYFSGFSVRLVKDTE